MSGPIDEQDATPVGPKRTLRGDSWRPYRHRPGPYVARHQDSTNPFPACSKPSPIDEQDAMPVGAERTPRGDFWRPSRHRPGPYVALHQDSTNPFPACSKPSPIDEQDPMPVGAERTPRGDFWRPSRHRPGPYVARHQDSTNPSPACSKPSPIDEQDPMPVGAERTLRGDSWRADRHCPAPYVPLHQDHPRLCQMLGLDHHRTGATAPLRKEITQLCDELGFDLKKQYCSYTRSAMCEFVDVVTGKLNSRRDKNKNSIPAVAVDALLRLMCAQRFGEWMAGKRKRDGAAVVQTTPSVHDSGHVRIPDPQLPSCPESEGVGSGNDDRNICLLITGSLTKKPSPIVVARAELFHVVFSRVCIALKCGNNTLQLVAQEPGSVHIHVLESENSWRLLVDRKEISMLIILSRPATPPSRSTLPPIRLLIAGSQPVATTIIVNRHCQFHALFFKLCLALEINLDKTIHMVALEPGNLHVHILDSQESWMRLVQRSDVESLIISARLG
ncbi:hypothetical protein FN846DRAFT_921697 [Sphaerosporella brunnea]|uniref:Uncharacterized protein n=1 Tax=Sphaerosporella brunnea TaxID=1250544 RepID=A0A5J5EME9_9PEZI|nr:hypothetical protein FN846DRAFT_921697 [Sphaerosporella brunnea]